MKLHIVSILAAIIAATSTFNVSAADERNGRVIPLAKPACFGYTQIVGDRLCLFDADCRPIADYSAYSHIDTSDEHIYKIDDGSNIYFYNKDGLLFLTLPSDAEYSQYRDCVIYKTPTGYGGCAFDEKIYTIPYEEVQRAAEILGYDEYWIKLYEDKFHITDYIGNTGIPIESVLNNTWEESYTKPEVEGNYRISEALDNGNYIIYKIVRGGYDFGLCDSEGKVLVSPQFAVLSQLSNGMWEIGSSHAYDSYKYAIEKEITSHPNFIYDKVYSNFGDGLIGVRLIDKNGTRKLYLNEELKPVLDMSHTDYSLGTFHGGRALVSSDKYGKCIIDLNGDTLFRSYDFNVGYLFCNKNLLYLGSTRYMKCRSIVYLPTCTLPIQEHMIPWDNGEIKQPYYSTDIKVTIDGETIQSYALDGRMMIVANELEEHGFSVQYNDYSRIFIADRDVSRENKSTDIKPETNTIGDMLGYTVKSDIGAYINGRYIETEAIDGQLLIEAEALCAPPDENDPDYWMLSYLGISPYLMSGEYDDTTRTLSIHTYTEDTE